ncbi:hypothetical protein Bhyg_11597 [Pseudolycoriella hygida]|uniref:Uncharacterized protein n=1 Tax=Pseudolycoriella hygida TaxID=35572 RepID=A0A9Q0MXA1_9DIPT|nr:hypothetical protein Bhyg_11597 [Pseudolycoriella hygida]
MNCLFVHLNFVFSVTSITPSSPEDPTKQRRRDV